MHPVATDTGCNGILFCTEAEMLESYMLTSLYVAYVALLLWMAFEAIRPLGGGE